MSENTDEIKPAEPDAFIKSMIANEDPALWEGEPGINIAPPEKVEEPKKTEEAPAPAAEKPAAETSAPVVESEAKPLSKEDEDFAAKFSALGQQEKKLREERKELEAGQKELKTAKTDPMEYLKGQGWNYDRITAHHLSGNKTIPPETATVQQNAEIAELRQELQNQKQERQQDKQVSAKNQYLGSINTELSSEDFETTRLFLPNPAEVVWSTVEQTYNSSEGKRALSPYEAADLVEQDLRNAIRKVAKTKWFQEEFGSTSTKQSTPPASQAKQTSTPQLTNDLSAEAPPTVDPDDFLFDDEAAMAHAVRQMRG